MKDIKWGSCFAYHMVIMMIINFFLTKEYHVNKDKKRDEQIIHLYHDDNYFFLF